MRVIRRLAPVFLGIATLSGSHPGLAAPTDVGKVAPDFELTLVDGSKVTLDQLRGNVIVLNFWATWCVPCREELPLLDNYYRRNKAGLKIFAITTEDSVPLDKLKGLFAAMAIPAVRKVRGPYGPLDAVPTNFIIDRTGHIRYAKSNAMDLDTLNSVLTPLLREGAPARPTEAPTI